MHCTSRVHLRDYHMKAERLGCHRRRGPDSSRGKSCQLPPKLSFAKTSRLSRVWSQAFATVSNSCAVAAASFGDLPQALHLSILLQLPLVQRVRCTLVSKRWAALLQEPAFWSDLSFEKADHGLLQGRCGDTFLDILRRSAGQLRSLVVPSAAAYGAYGDGGEIGNFLSALAAGGLTGKLERLSMLHNGDNGYTYQQPRGRRPNPSGLPSPALDILLPLWGVAGCHRHPTRAPFRRRARPCAHATRARHRC